MQPFFVPWYVLGPGHRWPYLLLPMYKLMELLPSTRAGATRLGLVTLEQMFALFSRGNSCKECASWKCRKSGCLRRLSAASAAMGVRTPARRTRRRPLRLKTAEFVPRVFSRQRRRHLNALRG